MTLEELIISFDKPGYTPKKLSEAILSWFKEQLPKEKKVLGLEYSVDDINEYVRHKERVNGYNQCLKDILTNLTALLTESTCGLPPIYKLADAILEWHTGKMDMLVLCTNIECDKGMALSADGTSSVSPCPECAGRGFTQKERGNNGKSGEAQ